MKTEHTTAAAEAAEETVFLGDDWFDPLEAGVIRTRFPAHNSASVATAVVLPFVVPKVLTLIQAVKLSEERRAHQSW